MVVRKDAYISAGKFRSIDQRRMTKLIEDDHVILPRQGGKCTKRGGVSGTEGQSGFRPLPIRYLLLEPKVRRKRAADQPRRPGTHAVLVDRGLCCLLEGGFRRETQVVIRREIDQLA